MYKAVVYFTDLQDDRYAYNPGDVFPREGLKVSGERLAELSSNNNKRGYPVIELAKEAKPLVVEEEPVIDLPEPKDPVIEEDVKIAKKPRKGRRKKNAD